MDQKQVDVLLEKINSLNKNIRMGDGQVSAIERDLMLNYIRQLYEQFLSDGVENTPQPAPPARLRKAPPKKPRIIEIPDSLKELPNEPVRSPQPAPRPEPEPTRKQTPPPPPRSNPSPATGEFEQLFEVKQARELSEKLSERPINDLTKAFAINDRLLYTNELFTKDQNEFNETLKLLNKFESLEEAKSLLITLADQHDWLDEEKLETARSFIKTVRRRYSG